MKNKQMKNNWAAWVAAAMLAGCDPASKSKSDSEHEHVHAQTLFVLTDSKLIAFDVATGEQLSGEIPNVSSPVDPQVLGDGTLLANLTSANQVLVIDAMHMLEKARLASSSVGGLRPVHTYISPERDGKKYWLTLNDGSDEPKTNSALFIDIVKDSADYLKPVGEVRVGVGHHKAAFSSTRERVVISNIADCDNVMTVYDYTDVSAPSPITTLTAVAAGWNGTSFPTTCDPTYQAGLPPAPHGCATSKVSGKSYCALTANGAIVSIDIDAVTPSFSMITTTTGHGGGYTAVHPTGKYVYSLQEEPREGLGGETCQIGQLAVIDAATDQLADEVPLFYDGPGCAKILKGTDEETANPGHILITHDGKKMFIGVAGGFGVKAARVRRQLVLDLSDPAHPVQKPSVTTGTGTGHRGETLSGDGKYLFVVNNVDGSVTQIDTATDGVVRTIKAPGAQVVATFGSQEGPSHQTGPID